MAGFLCTKVSLFGPWTQVVWRRNCTWMQIRLGCQVLGWCGKQRSILRLGVLVPAGLSLPHLLRPALCKHKYHTSSQNLMLTLEHSQMNTTFDWSKFLEYLSPEWLWLLLAIAAALVVSVLNIQIPLEMGRLVNVVAGFTPGGSLGTYLERLSLPALHLCALYLTQGCFTFLYISFLSHLGERLSVRLRTSLFHSLLQSHISFFDTHRTGELVNRLTADVQDFKSSFKMVISQGLRSTTQTLGCFVSLYLISPQMAGVVAVALPVVIGVGSLIGATLRQWSRQAQQQVAVSTCVAQEALSNVRTVRAFAMEDYEVDLYSRDLRTSQSYNERLGFGIAAFQALSNITVNGAFVKFLYSITRTCLWVI
ncbi:Mitochondrial potassium channel ATP-binding subunit [Geodia barretti]|uniref:Mitochondrial potassium channel ATP-binding subunit n=1 Tax=Geodia barretti TaxID=519541 RepID=A0AA35WQD3_GEOBA|nr:Mitochondrial potassium channel ATP-binding subunit [Geodia barretti]